MLGLSVIALATLVGMSNNVETIGFYPTTMLVSEVNHDDLEMSLIDFNGDEWVVTIDYDDDYEENDVMSLIMCDMGTENIYDDNVANMRYIGHLNGEIE